MKGRGIKGEGLVNNLLREGGQGDRSPNNLKTLSEGAEPLIRLQGGGGKKELIVNLTKSKSPLTFMA